MKHKARKRFGQNFLVSGPIIARIVDAINPQPTDLLIEIGPGQAALTDPLAESGAELHLVELDRDLVGGLQRRFLLNDGVRVHEADALTVDFAELTDQRPFRLVGNLPYNISTPLLFHVLDWSDLVIDMHFMLQQEVVNRMAAEPGSKAWGRLSIMCQLRCQVIPLFTVPPESFQPAPKVDSAIVRLLPHRQPPAQVNSMQSLERIVTQAFSMRRKTLRNGLKGLLDASQMEASGIDPSRRPETLDLTEFATLANLLN